MDIAASRDPASQTLQNVERSLSDLLGVDYTDAVCDATARIWGEDLARLKSIAEEKVNFFPPSYLERVNSLIDFIGKKVCSGLSISAQGASTRAFEEATTKSMAPISGMGFIRIGEDGRAYLISKSEHYHASLGHNFPGYGLINNARMIGITNITHNNTRGHITRLLEERIVAAVNGIAWGDRANLDEILKSDEPHILNRVINLETGSLAVEAALKMMLARFYRLQHSSEKPRYYGKTPVFLVMADYEGGSTANYHGTTVLTQILRGMWPDVAEKFESHDVFQVMPVRINDSEHFAEQIRRFDTGKSKVAGFIHEIILMNYGGVRLDADFLQNVHTICKERDIPVMVDEIQSCIWSPGLFLFRDYDLRPDFVSLGKGFPGGEYPASKIVTTAPMDNLNQFGALVTNGQEELASLAYLITIAFAEANGDHTRWLGEYYHRALITMAENHDCVVRIEGLGHLSSIVFHNAEDAARFSSLLNDRCIDISAHTYKESCPPSALTKLPLISSKEMVDFLIDRMDHVLSMI